MPFPPFDHARFIAEAWAQGPPTHNLGSSAFVPDDPLKGLPRTVEEIDISGFDLHAATAFREAAAKHVGVPAEHVRPCAGTTAANLVVTAGCLDRGTRVVSERPFYAPLPNTAAGLGQGIDFVDRGDDGHLDPDAVVDAITNETSLVVLSSPNNPTGAVAGRDALLQIADAAERHDAMVLVDQVYRELTDHPIAGTLHPNLVTSAGLNKCWGAPGLRAGWVLGDPDFLEAVEEIHRTLILGPSAPGTRLATAMLPHAASRRTEMETRLAANHAVYEAWAEANGLSPVHGAITAFPEMLGHDTMALAKRLLNAGMLVIPGEAFGRAGHVRIGLGVPTEPLRRALDAFAELW